LLGFDEVLTTAPPRLLRRRSSSSRPWAKQRQPRRPPSTELRASLDLLHGNITRIDTTQQQLVAQLGLIADGVQESTRRHDEAARRLETLDHRLGYVVPARDLSRGCPPSLEEDDADPDENAPHGKATLCPVHVTWTGNGQARHRPHH
jgi:hypothetical protein